jgi:hypothetical protein
VCTLPPSTLFAHSTGGLCPLHCFGRGSTKHCSFVSEESLFLMGHGLLRMAHGVSVAVAFRVKIYDRNVLRHGGVIGNVSCPGIWNLLNKSVSLAFRLSIFGPQISDNRHPTP